MSNFISLSQAIAMTTEYRSHQESILLPEFRNKSILPNSETFEAASFQSLLNQKGCASIRVYLGMGDDLKVRIIAVGVDDKGDDILPEIDSKTVNDDPGGIVEDGQRCPDICHGSPLNP